MIDVIVSKFHSFHKPASELRRRTELEIIHNLSDLASAVIYIRVVEGVVFKVVSWGDASRNVDRLEDLANRGGRVYVLEGFWAFDVIVGELVSPIERIRLRANFDQISVVFYNFKDTVDMVLFGNERISEFAVKFFLLSYAVYVFSNSLSEMVQIYIFLQKQSFALEQSWRKNVILRFLIVHFISI